LLEDTAEEEPRRCPSGYSCCGGETEKLCCSDNGNITGVSAVIAPWCPPPPIFQENAGSVVCYEECSRECCSLRSAAVALRVSGDDGVATTNSPYDSGEYKANRGGCWFMHPADCVFGDNSTSCGFSYVLRVHKLNDEARESNSVVKALDNAIKDLISVTLVKNSGYR
jgi:hypothetical protein